MSDVWYCIDESDTGDWVTSIWDGLGIPAAQIPSTGESGAAYLFNDIAEQGASPTDEFSSTILTVPPVGVFTHDEYSALSFTGAADGVYYATYSAELNGVPYLNPGTAGGEWVITMTIGPTSVNYDIGGTSSLTLAASGDTRRNTAIGGTSAFTITATGDTTYEAASGNYNIGGISSVAITASGDTQRATTAGGITSLVLSATAGTHRNTAIGGVSALTITARANLIEGDQPRFGVIRLLPTTVRIKIRVGA